jgi:hypothetical protein
MTPTCVLVLHPIEPARNTKLVDAASHNFASLDASLDGSQRFNPWRGTSCPPSYCNVCIMLSQCLVINSPTSVAPPQRLALLPSWIPGAHITLRW